MKFGMGFPLGVALDPAEIRDAGQRLDAGGVDYVTLSGHLLSTEAGRFPDRPAPAYSGTYLNPIVTFSYLAAVTSRLEFMTSTLILPLFSAAMLAKQAADLAALSGGRLVLGVSVSWNPNEYQAAGQDFHTRGKRFEEQIGLMRRLWTEPYVTFQGRFHALEGVGLNTLPARPIPIWIGCGTSDALLRRVAKLADGYIPLGDPSEALPRLRSFLAEEHRDPAGFGLTGRLNAAEDDPGSWAAQARQLRTLGTTRVTVGGPPGASLRETVERVIKVKGALAGEFGD